MKKAENWGFWLTCLCFGIGLAILNYAMAVGAVGKVRDAEADLNRNKQAVHSALRAELARAEAARAALPSFTPTTSEMVETGKMAVNLAIQARDQECKIVGDFCRARVVQLSSRQSELAELSKNFALTERARVLDITVADAGRASSAVGPTPQYTDAQASRLAGVVHRFVDLGPDAAERVADWLVSILAIAAEAIGLGLPRVLVTALSPKARAEGPKTLVASDGKGPGGTAPAAAPAQKPPAQNASVPAPALRAATPTPIRRSTRPRANPQVWKAESVSFKAGGRVNCWNAYDNYRTWAESLKQAPDDFRNFCSNLALPTTETPPISSSFFLDVDLPVKLKVVKA